MITEKMLSAINDIDDEMITDAAPGSRSEKMSYARRRRMIYRVASLAACLCVVVAVLAVTGIGDTHKGRTGSDNNMTPAKNDASTHDLVSEGTVPEGEKNAHAIMPDYSQVKTTVGTSSIDGSLPKIGILSPLQNGAGGYIEFCPKGTVPGKGFMEPSDVPERLAVYHHEGVTAAGDPVGLDREAMSALLNTYAQRLGIDAGNVTEQMTEDESGKETLAGLIAADGDTELRVDAGAGVYVSMPEGSMPADVNSILGFSDPVVDEFWTYRFSEERDNSAEYIRYSRWYRIVTENNDPFPLKIACIYEPISGQIHMYICDYALVTEKLGEYPVISPEKALELLKEGKYNAPEKNPEAKFPGEEHIVGLRIEYPLAPAYEYIVPYYVFTVMLPDVRGDNYLTVPNDAACFAEYYVPATDARYFESDTAIFRQ